MCSYGRTFEKCYLLLAARALDVQKDGRGAQAKSGMETRFFWAHNGRDHWGDIMKSGLLFRALPDSSSVQANVTPDGRLVSTMPNRMILSPAIQQQLAEVAYRFWEPSHVAWPDGLGWIINTCADADEYAGALDYLSRQIAGKDIPVFNHPDAIQKTRRDTVADLLSGIAGLQTPKCVRFLGDHPDRFHEVFNVNGFE